MKRFISILLAMIIMMVSVSAFAEATVMEDAFSIRNGITFGMTKEEIYDIEDIENFVRKKELEYTYYDENGDYMSTTTSGLRVTGSLAGIENSKLDYYFNDDKLFAVTYDFGDSAKSNFQNDYDVIQESLENKYSKKWIRVDKNDLYPRITDCFCDNYGGTKFKEFDCYYIQLDDDSRIYINHMLCYKNLTDSIELNLMMGGIHILEYRLITYEEMSTYNKDIAEKTINEVNELLEDIEEKENQMNSDL